MNMSGKHFIMKRIVVPLLTLILVCGMTVSAFAAETGSYDIAAGNPNITICYPVDNSGIDTGTIVTPIKGQDIEVGDIGEVSVSKLGVDGLKRSLDDIYGVKRYGGVAVVGVPFYNGITLYDGLKTQEFLKLYNANKDELIQAVRLAYPNETNQWYDEYIALPIYYGVINGYEDGTLQPNRPVAVSEVAKIVATAYESNIPSGGYLNNNAFNNGNGMWYNNYYNKMAKAFTYKSSAGITPQYMESNMRRCEVAYVLASVCDDGTLKDYIAKAERGDISQMSGYVDFVNVVRTDVDLSIEQARMNAGEIPARFAGAVMYLQAKGIMVGDGAGHINPLDNVTRAEVFKLIQTTCQNTPSYTKNKFYGWENKPTSGTVTQQPGQTQMTEQTVLNPNAPAELQYKVSDINQSSYKYILNGQANIAEKQLRKEYTQPIVDQIKSTVQFKDGYTEITIPDLKSDYHEVYVMYDVNENGKWVGGTVYTSTQQSGTIRMEGNCYGMVIGIQGREDKASIKSKAAGSSYMWAYSIERGGWEAY